MTTTQPASDALLDRKKREARWLAIGFGLVLGLIIVDLIARNWYTQYRALWDFYVVWEASSIAFTIVLTIFHWLKYIDRGKGTAYTTVIEADNKKFHVFGFIILSAIALIAAGLLAICIGLCKNVVNFPIDLLLFVEAVCLTLGVAFVVTAELKVIKAVPMAKGRADQEIASITKELAGQTDLEAKKSTQNRLNEWQQKRSNYDDILDDVGKFLAFSDAPIGVAFFVICLVVGAHWIGWTGADSHLLPPFIAGAVALQLLYSNFVFYIEANGEFPKWARKCLPALELVTPMIQGKLSEAEPPGHKPAVN